MLAALRETLRTHVRPACLCWYGDHVPIMPSTYARLGEPAGETVYCLWRSDRLQTLPATPQALPVEDLAVRLCVAAGLWSAPSTAGTLTGSEPAN